MRTVSSLKVALGVALAFACLAPSVARAQEDDPAGLTGTWKRDGDPPRNVRFDLDPSTGELVGRMLNPPLDGQGKPYGVDIRLKLSGKKLEGRATWSEENPDKETPGQPERFTCDTRWELTVDGPDKLSGKVEWIEWDKGQVLDRGFEQHTFERLRTVSLASGGTVAPEKVEAGQPIEGAALAGTWKTHQGWAVAFKPQEPGWVLERVKGEGDYPASVRLTNDGNVLKGVAKWADGIETAVELKLTAPGRLEGRAERAEGEKGESKTWAPWVLERLARIDGPADASAAEPPALDTGTKTGASAPIALDLKREDGLYLKLEAKDGGAYEGDLVSKTEGVRAKVSLAPDGSGKLVGKATFKVEGADVEARWELLPAADGTIDARCEWLDWDPLAKTAVARGFAARKFKPLRKVG